MIDPKREFDLLKEIFDARVTIEMTIPQAMALQVLLESVIDEEAPKLDMLQFGPITHIYKYLNKSLSETRDKIRKGMKP